MGADEGIPEIGELNLSLPGIRGEQASTYTTRNTTIVGRSTAADLNLDDPTVSRRHAEFYVNMQGDWRVRDLGSHNGISVNGRPARDSEVQHGDIVHIGGVKLNVGIGGPAKQTTPDTPSAVDIRPSQAVTIGRLSSPVQPKLEADHLFTIQKLVKRLLDEPDPHKRLILLCRQMLGPPLGAHHAAVVQFPHTGEGGATLVAGPETVSHRARESFYLSRSVVEALRTSNEPVLASNDPSRDTSAAPLSMVGGNDHFAVAACPLPGPDPKETRRVLYVVLPALLGSMEWLALAALVAEQYSHAEIAWHERVTAERQAVIDRDLKQARRIQLALVPNRVELSGLDVAIRFKPCRTVGGDYVDAFALPDGRALFVVADVAGKGMQAALIASSLHTWLHATVACTGDLAESMSRLNRYLHETLPDGTFATLIAVTLDPDSGDLTYVNAGHPPILLASPDGIVRELQTGSNLPLGVMDADMKLEHDRITRDESLLLYTDGLTESLNPDGSWLGVEGVGRCLTRALAGGGEPRPVHDAADDLISLVEKQTTGFDADDRTLLLAARG